MHKLLPYSAKLHIFRALGRIAYPLYRSRRKIARVNVSLCFPNMPDADRKALVRRTFENFFISFLEIAISWWGKDDGILDNVSFDGTEHLDNALAKGKGVILMGAHFSTTELGAALVRKYNAPDQDHGISNAVFAPFFAHPAATLTTTATLAKISDAPVIMMGNYRKSDNTGYCVKFLPPIDNFPSDDDRSKPPFR